MYPDNLTRAETRARAELIDTSAYRVEIDLTGRGVEDVESRFRSVSTVTFTARRAGTLHLDLIADRVVTAQLDGQDLDPATFDSSRLGFAVQEGEHELKVDAVCRYSRTGEGLHRFSDPADGRIYTYTQFEAADARRMFACFEQPDLKAAFTFTVHAPEDWTVVSNGLEISRHAGPAGTATWQFAETAPISTYLTALVAGDYARVDQSYAAAAGELPMAILCRQSLIDHLDADRIFRLTVDGFGVFERHFGFPYPFGKYDQVFVPEYNGGAMENVGCVTVRDEYIFRSRATPAAYVARDDTLLHELSHMWFGDLVTMRWWDDLWLKESFATWASNFASSELADDPATAWASFTNGFKSWAYRQDQLPSTHPIAADIVDLEAVEQNFDGITYAKGAAVLVQLVAFVGREAFLEGLRRYFAEHAYGNTELGDLLRALEGASGRDLSTWSAQWLETTGVNTLSADFGLSQDGTFERFAVRQSAAAEHPTLREHRIAVGLYASLDQPGGPVLRRIGRVETDLSGASTEVSELVGLRQPDLVLLNDDDLSYAKVRLDQRSLATVLDGMPQLESPLARAVCWASTWDMCRDAELPAADYVELALRGVAVESDHTAVQSVLGQAASAIRHYSPVSARDALTLHWQRGVSGLLADATPGSDHQLALAKAFPSAAQDAEAGTVLERWLAGADVPEGLRIDPELRWSVVRHLARLGRLDAAEIEVEQERDRTITGAEQAAAAKAARPTEEAKREAWRLVAETDSVPNGTQRAVCLAFWQPGQDEVLAPYVDRYLDAAEAISANRDGWADRGTALRSNVLRFLFPVPRELESFLARLDAWRAEHDLAESVRRPIEEGRDNTLRALRCQLAAAS
jgi:aminopeptidase N